MPNRKETSKTPISEAAEEDPSYKDQVELLMQQLEEARGVAKEAQEKAFLAEESHDRVKERLRRCEAAEIEGRDQVQELHRRIEEFQVSQGEQNEKVRELQQKLSKNCQYLEKCTQDNADLSDELFKKTKELEASKRAASKANHHAPHEGSPLPFIRGQPRSPPSRNLQGQLPPSISRLLPQQFPARAPLPALGDVPLPRQTLFDGTSSWESFFKPFLALSRSCNWSHEERLFRLTNSLRGEAAEYAFCYLPNDTLHSFDQLVSALEVRFKDHSPMTAYLAQLEARRLQPREKVSEFLADIRKLVLKSYPTADERTRETIGVRHFLKGLSDPQMAVAVGMKDPQTLDEARAALDTYSSLEDDLGRVPRVRVATAVEEAEFVTQQQLRSFKEELVLEFDKKFTQLEKLLETQGRKGGQSRSRAEVECYKCHGMGHYARECPEKKKAEKPGN